MKPGNWKPCQASFIVNSKESKIILNLSFLSWKSWKLWRSFRSSYVERISETFTCSINNIFKNIESIWRYWECYYRRIEGPGGVLGLLMLRISETFTSSTKTSSKICYWKCYYRRIEGFLINLSLISLESPVERKEESLEEIEPLSCAFLLEIRPMSWFCWASV